jgi:hypothetical protein
VRPGSALAGDQGLEQEIGALPLDLTEPPFVAEHAEPVEFYLEPIQIPVGTTLCRLADSGEEPVARYDGLAWRRPAREG